MSHPLQKRIVIKIGSSSLTAADGTLDRLRLETFTDGANELSRAGHEVVIVTSGAISSGFRRLGMKRRPTEVAQKQAAAAVGQSILMHSYAEAFARYEKTIAQILLSRHDLTVRESFNNARATLDELILRGVVPIVNENDTVATEELRFGDNDILSAFVAGLVHADLLVIITDTDGIYTADPRTDANAKRISRVAEITPEITAAAGGSGTSVGTGGMRAKVIAAARSLDLGVPVFIGEFSEAGDLTKILSNEGAGTYIGDASLSTLSTKRQWIGLHGEVRGRLIVDAGAMDAVINKGRSLLPAGIVAIEGDFARGELVEVYEKQCLGRGVTAYSSEDLSQVLGKSSDFVSKTLGNIRTEVIHRDEWFSLFEEI